MQHGFVQAPIIRSISDSTASPVECCNITASPRSPACPSTCLQQVERLPTDWKLLHEAYGWKQFAAAPLCHSTAVRGALILGRSTPARCDDASKQLFSDIMQLPILEVRLKYLIVWHPGSNVDLLNSDHHHHQIRSFSALLASGAFRLSLDEGLAMSRHHHACNVSKLCRRQQPA